MAEKRYDNKKIPLLCCRILGILTITTENEIITKKIIKT